MHDFGKIVRTLAFAILVSSNLYPQENPSQASKSPEQLMDGEKVLAVKEAPLLNPIFRQASQVWFELQNVRPGSNLRDALEADYAYDGSISGAIHVVVHTNGKRLRFPIEVSSLASHQGVLKCSYDAISDKSPMGADLEVYVELTDSEPSKSKTAAKPSSSKIEPADPLFFKVSKSATRGNVETLTYGRQMRESEQRIFLQRLKKYGPPPPPPAGTQLLADDVALVPGVPILGALEGEWRKAEVLARFPKGAWVVHWPHLGHKSNTLLTGTHIAVSESTLATLREENGATKFKPSVMLAKGSLEPPPEGFAVLPAGFELVPGTPVKVFMGGSYWDYTVVENGTQTVSVVNNAFARRSESIDRSQLIIEKDVGRRLGDPKLRTELAERLKTLLAANARPSPSYSMPAKSYTTTQPLPLGHVKASASTQLKVGDRGLVFWGSSWSKVTVTAVPEGGDVEVQWEGWSSREKITRESLAVADSMPGAKDKEVAAADTKPTTVPAPKKEPIATAPKKETKAGGLYALKLDDPGPRKIPVAKLIMSITRMSLVQANEVVENTPIELRNDLPERDAEQWKKMLEKLGAKASVEAVMP